MAAAQFWKSKQNQLLKEEDAFQVTASVSDQGKLELNWLIAEDYYMYRDQFSVEVILRPERENTTYIGALQFPQGVVEDDPEFGQVEVYFYNALLTADIQGEPLQEVEIAIKGQGCNKPVGVCYPPINRTVQVTLPQSINAQADTYSEIDRVGEEQILPSEKSFIGFLLAAFGTGILLSFTPCVLPMIPILAGVIAGQKSPNRWQSTWLAICYVAGTVVTYMVAGAVAGATGAQLQAWFQNAWVIGGICALLVALALSLFGVYRIELPSSLQTKLTRVSGEPVQSTSMRSAAMSSFSLGLISALVVGACVSPLLIVALGAAITQGDPILGAGIMGSMALGMGSLLIFFGMGAGWLLPKAGGWMSHIQVIFGFSVLGVALYLLAAFPVVPILFLWMALLLATGFYLWRITDDVSHPLVNSIIRAIAAIFVVWGVLSGVGASLRGDDVLNPLGSLSLSNASATSTQLPFVRTTSLHETLEQLAIAKAANKPVMLDFYADWCLDCKRMHRTTYKENTVKEALVEWHLIEVDVTVNSEVAQKVKKQFNVFGPPATLFFDVKGQELEKYRQYGFINKNAFLALIQKTQASVK